MRELPKGNKVVCLRIDSELNQHLYDLAAPFAMKVATYAKRVLYDHVASQRLLSNQCNQRRIS